MRPFVSDFSKLSAVEEAFCYLYRRRLDPQQVLEDTPDEIAAVLQKEPFAPVIFRKILEATVHEPVIGEDKFSDPADITCNIHPRYLPCRDHTHRYFEMQYVLTGSCSQTIGGRSFSMQAGDICIITPDTVHNLHVYNDHTIVINFLIRKSTFTSSFVHLLNQGDIVSEFFIQAFYNRNPSPYLLCRTGSDALEELVMTIFKECQQEGELSSRARNVSLEMLFIRLLREYENRFVIAGSSHSRDNNIVAILRYMQTHYQNVTLQEIAEVFGYSEAHLSRMIKKSCNQTFSRLLQSIKVRTAADMLMIPNMSIATIVETVGYADRSHFYRIFKEHYKMTPNEYKQNRSA